MTKNAINWFFLIRVQEMRSKKAMKNTKMFTTKQHNMQNYLFPTLVRTKMNLNISVIYSTCPNAQKIIVLTTILVRLQENHCNKLSTNRDKPSTQLHMFWTEWV